MKKLLMYKKMILCLYIMLANLHLFAADTQAPTVPSNLNASVILNSTFTLLWNASTDNVSIIRYELYLNGVWKANVSPTTQYFTYTGLAPKTTYAANVATIDAAGNWVVSSALNIKTSTSNTPSSFYVSSSGNDNNSGTSINSPWKTINRVNEQTYNPGVKFFSKMLKLL
jgi:Fibronectin type III domain